MTAYRIIEDHNELENIGSLTHDQIDSHINNTAFVIISGSSPVPSSSRQLVAGSGISIIDNGPGSTVIISSSGSAGNFVYPNDLLVTLKGGKSFGKYASGQTIPSTGKTPAEVIMMAIAEPIDPTLSLTGSNPLATDFNAPNPITTSITASYIINSSGASVSTVSLDYRTGGAGAWTTLTTSTSDPLTYDHVFDPGSFFTSTLDYRYVVTDDQGATATATLDLTPQGYAAPTINLSIVRSSPGSVIGETDVKREIGNVGSNLSGVITRQRVNVPITSYSVQFSTNGSSWADVPGLSSVPVVGNPASVTIPVTLHNDLSLINKTTIYYRVRVIDIYQTTNSSLYSVSFLRTLFYGPTTSNPLTSSDVRSLANVRFTDVSNPFNLETGNVQRFFCVAIPSNLSVTEVLDLDALNANITANYVLNTFNVDDDGGTPVSYHVYTMSNAIPYTSNHRHRITRA